MSDRVESPPFPTTRLGISSWMPSRTAWLALAVVLGTGLVADWFLAAGVVVVLILMVARPFDFIVSFLVVAGYAAFVHYEGGRVTHQFTILLILQLFMGVCYLLQQRSQVFDFPRSRLAIGVLLYVGLSAANYVRGLAAGYPWKYATTEMVATAGLLTVIMVANTFEARRDLKLAFAGLMATAIGSAVLGFYIFSVIRVRTGGFYFIPIPGIAGMFLLNLAMRSRDQRITLLTIFLSLPLFLHQFLSFRRGVWLGCIAGLLAMIPIYTGWRRGSRPQWRRLGFVYGVFLGCALLGAITMALAYGQMDILEQAGGRFASIGGTETRTEHWSNLDRITEALVVIGHIMRSPIVGHGLGYFYLNTEPLTQITSVHFWVDQNYLMIWLKVGLVGLALFLWLLWTATWHCIREARRRQDPWESSWFATTAAATICMGVFALFDWPFAQIYSTCLMGLLWGGAIAMTGGGTVRLRWSAPPS